MIVAVSLASVAVVFFCVLAIAKRALDQDNERSANEMDARLNALRDMGGKNKGDFHGQRYS